MATRSITSKFGYLNCGPLLCKLKLARPNAFRLLPKLGEVALDGTSLSIDYAVWRTKFFLVKFARQTAPAAPYMRVEHSKSCSALFLFSWPSLIQNGLLMDPIFCSSRSW